MSQMTDAEVKQAIERHRIHVVPHISKSLWTAATANEFAMEKTLTEAVAEVVRQIEETQE